MPKSTGALRFSLSRLTSAADVEHAARGLADALVEIERAVRPGR